MTLFGGIEAGGTKFVCAVGTGPGDLRVRTSFPTTTPAETIAQAITFFKQQRVARLREFRGVVTALHFGHCGGRDEFPAEDCLVATGRVSVPVVGGTDARHAGRRPRRHPARSGSAAHRHRRGGVLPAGRQPGPADLKLDIASNPGRAAGVLAAAGTLALD